MAVNMEVGLCHPAVGLNLYVASGITKMGITELTIAVLPWLGTMLVFLVMVTYIPEISLWLPRALGMLYYSAFRQPRCAQPVEKMLAVVGGPVRDGACPLFDRAARLRSQDHP